MKRDAFLFFTLALITAAIGLADIAGNVGETALLLSLVFLTLTATALVFVRPLPA